MSGGSGATIRFGVFELDTRTRELRKCGIRLKLPQQAYCVLRALLDSPGELVTRDQLRHALWPDQAFAEFDGAINKCVSRIRMLLGDMGPTPRFIETLSKRGYRFIAPVSGQFRGATRNATAIAVLPFQNLTGDPTFGYLADGIAEALTTALGGLKGIRVISGTSARACLQARKSVQAIGRDLNVNLAVEGSVMRFAQLRVGIRVIDIEADSIVWKRTYDGELKDVLALCDQAAEALTAELQGSHAREFTASASSPATSAAYLTYLKGRYLWNKRNESDLYRSLAEFEAAVAIDPGFALAHAGMADVYVLLGILGLEPSSSAFRNARTAAERAVDLNSNLAEAHTCLAEVLKDHDWDWQGAEERFRRAIALNPNYSTARHYYAQLLVTQRRFAEAAEEIELARRIDPLSPAINAYVPYIYLASRDYARALKEGQRAIDLEPSSALARWQFGRACLLSGDVDRAVAELDHASQLANRRSLWQAMLSFALARAGDRSGAERILSDLTALAEGSWVSPYDLALCYVGIGDLESALDSLEEAYGARVMRIISIGDPELEALYPETRFASLIQQLDLPSPWQ